MRGISVKSIAAAALACTSLYAAPAMAAPQVTVPSCTVVTFNVSTISCLGFYSGNLVTDSGPKLTEALGYVGQLDSGATSLITKYDISGSNANSGGTIDFGTALGGKTVIGLHFGGGGTGYNGTAFWLLDIPTGTDSITWSSTTQKGLSNAGLYLTDPGSGVPEPATWAMMMLGVGAVGGAMRAARRQRVAVTYG